MKPCEGKNSNVCVAEGCYGEACERVSDSAAFERQARALEGIDRNTHEIMKIFADISGVFVEMRDELRGAAEAINTFAELGAVIKEQIEKDGEIDGKE